jgi:hypothetical protein
MRPLIQEFATAHTPESLLERVPGGGAVLLRTGSFDSPQARYSFVATRPFLTMRSFGSRCEFSHPGLPARGVGNDTQFGNPWKILEGLMARYELLD